MKNECQSIVKQSNYSIYICSLFTKEQSRNDIYALYAWYAEIKKVNAIAKEEMARLVRFAWWRDAITEIYQGKPSRHPVLIALAQTIVRHSIEQKELLELIDVVAAEPEMLPPKDMKALEKTLERSEGKIAQLAQQVIGQSIPAIKHIALAFGIVTMLCRMPKDIGNEQIYIPETLMKKHHTTPKELIMAEQHTALQPIVKTLVEKSETHLAQAQKNIKNPPKEALPLLLPAVIARHVLKKIRAQHFDTMTHPKPNIKSPWLLLKIACHAYLKKW